MDLVFNKSLNISFKGSFAFDRVLMFKILVLQSLCTLSDDAYEFQINDRLSFKRFHDNNASDRDSGGKTMWVFRTALIRQVIIEALFLCFNKALDQQKVFGRIGQIVAANFVEVPQQRNDREEHDPIKTDEIPETRKAQTSKLRQKDRYTRWTKKKKMTLYGFKSHINPNAGSTLISINAVTNAAIHDSVAQETLIDRDDAVMKLLGDGAYIVQNEGIDWYGLLSGIHEKGIVKNKLIDSNRNKSKLFARIEHIVGFMTNTMKSRYVMSIRVL